MSTGRKKPAARKPQGTVKGDSNMDENKMMLEASAAEGIQTAHSAAIDEFLAPDRPHGNVKGMGVGIKWSKGKPTGEPALVVLVNQKLPENVLTKSEVVPKKLQGVQTDVLAIGEPFAGGDAGIQTLAKRIRPAEGGYSVGHFKITAGTIATCVYDILPGGTVTPPAHGIGIPPRYYILSNNHVLANSNDASIGDPILQPGPFDGGISPADIIARLSRFIPIVFSPAVPLPQHNNLVDAAIAEGQFHDLDREIYWSGYVKGWRQKSKIAVGLLVKKTGRTTNFTTGRITAINATVDVNYGAGKVARFRDQIITTAMSAGGDSGSLIITSDPVTGANVAVGLLFAGSSVATIANQIENVRSLLRIEVADQVM